MIKNTIAFTVRDMKIFLRDRAAVFFSFLSTLILVSLYFLFIAKIYIDGINESVMNISNSAAGFIVYSQMMAGVLILNSMSLSLGMFTVVSKDFETGRTDSFLITPAKKSELLISYYISGLIISFILNLFTWIISVCLIGVITGYWISAGAFFLAVVVLIVASLISSSLMLFLTALSKSSVALGVINGIAGTFFGFLCGIYMPYTNLGAGVEKAGSFLPFTHLTIWLKNIVLTDALSQIGVPTEVKTVLMEEWFTATSIGFCGLDAPLWAMLLASGVFGAGCIAAAGFLLNKRMRQK